MIIGEKTDKKRIFLAFLVGIITFLIFLPSLQNEFVEWDDDQYVFENPFIRSFDSNFFRWAFFDFYAANWHPLTWISHALDYAIWELNPMGHHLTNNILHSVNSFLVVLLVARLIAAVGNSSASVRTQEHSPERTDPPGAGDSRFTIHDSRLTLIAASTTGLLFGLHPLHVESVAWVAERKDLLCALFFLLSVMAYMRYAGNIILSLSPVGKPSEMALKKRKDPGQARMTEPGLRFLNRHYLLSLAFFILALLSKPMAVSLPLVLLILDWHPFNRITSFKTFRTAFIEKLPFIVLSVISSLLTILAQREAIELNEFAPLSVRLLMAAKSLIAYLLKMALPVNLIPYYPYPQNVPFFSLAYLSPIVLFFVITILSLFAAKRQRAWLSVWGYYLVTLAPVLGILQVGGQAMADRYSYLPSVGPFLLCGAGVAWVYSYLANPGKHGPVLKLLCSASALSVLVSLSYLTIEQIKVWKNSTNLWSYVIEEEPGIPFAYNNIGIAFFKKEQLDKAIEAYQTSVALAPRYVKAHLNLGNAYAKKGLRDKALEEYQIVARLNPGSAETHYQLGSALNAGGFLNEAIEQWQLAVKLKPDFGEAHNNLAAALYSKGIISEALDHYLIFAKLNPANALAHLNLGSAYAATGSFDRAIEHFQIAVRLKPDLADAHYNLGMAYQTKGMIDQAVEHLEAAARLNPADAAIRNDLARAYSLKKDAGSP
ncbi:MAG: tetratricopeptide repeat protein [Thermodesulfovibrionales bacterium]